MTMKLPTLEELLKKGVYFGHKTSKWHPNMEQFIYTSRNGVHILDLSQTLERLKAAYGFIKEMTAQGKTVLFVGTKKAIKEIMKKSAQAHEVPYVNVRWLGGTITNFSSINGLVKKLERIEKQESALDYEKKYTKKERHDFNIEKERFLKMIGGITQLEKIPDALFIVDIRQDKTAVREAQRKGIPVVAIVDSNVNPEGIAYPIPANDDSIKSVEFILSFLLDAVDEGRKLFKEKSEGDSEVDNLVDLKDDQDNGIKSEARNTKSETKSK